MSVQDERLQQAEAEAQAWQDNYHGIAARWAESEAERVALRRLYPSNPGDVRDPAAFASCAVEPCDSDATSEILHTPGDGSAIWVPMCAFHLTVAPSGGIAYMVEAHGFIPPLPEVER